MMHCARELGRNLSLWELQQLLQTANEFGVDRVRMACLDIAVFGFSDIMRCVSLQTLVLPRPRQLGQHSGENACLININALLCCDAPSRLHASHAKLASLHLSGAFSHGTFI